MRKKKKFIALILAVLLVISANPVATAADVSESEILSNEAHVYSIVPGTEAWNEMTPSERYASCSVSEQEVKNMTTEALVETVLNYPYLINIYAFDSLEMGISEVSRYFPGIQELANRSDAVSVLGQYVNDRAVAMSDSDKEVDLALYDAYTLMGYIGAIEPSSTTTLGVTNVYTPNGNSVPVIVDMNWVEVSAYLGYDSAIDYDYALAQSKQCETVYPSATLYRNPAPNYNCHSYAWYSTATTNKYWMPDPSEYIEDGSYEGTTAAVGCKVTYYRLSDGVYTHSGRIVATPGGPVTVRSKWGALGVFTHDVDDCPYVGNGESITVGSWGLA